MKTHLAVCGKFHAPFIAEELWGMGLLGSFHCATNRKDLSGRWPGSLVKHLGTYYALNLARRARLGADWERRIEDSFDRSVLSRLSRLAPGVLHGWNSHVHRTFKGLKGKGWLLCVERSCPENRFQNSLLREESASLGVPFDYDPAKLEKDCEELEMADRIICPSSYSAESYRSESLKRKVFTVPLGANLTMRPDFRRSDRRSPRILMVGNDFLRKGTLYLLQAFARIRDPEARLVIRGDVPERFRAEASDSRIRILEAVSREELDGWYRWANVFCLPSIDEGFGMVALEAASYGLPLVVTENVGCKDVLREPLAKVVPIRNPEALRNALSEQVMADEEVIWETARSVIERVTWRNTVLEYLRSAYAPQISPMDGSHAV